MESILFSATENDSIILVVEVYASEMVRFFQEKIQPSSINQVKQLKSNQVAHPPSPVK